MSLIRANTRIRTLTCMLASRHFSEVSSGSRRGVRLCGATIRFVGAVRGSASAARPTVSYVGDDGAHYAELLRELSSVDAWLSRMVPNPGPPPGSALRG